MKIKTSNFSEWRWTIDTHPKIQRAAMLAALFHAGQSRKYTEQEYIIHPYEVYQELQSHLSNTILLSKLDDIRISMLCAALMHDLLENTAVTEEDIEFATDKDALKLVKELTNPSKGVKAPRAIRKQMDREHLATASKEAKTIKLIDRIINLMDIQA
jgi:(p)ppGpp synthase/HD superfamily hydrolase